MTKITELTRWKSRATRFKARARKPEHHKQAPSKLDVIGYGLALFFILFIAYGCYTDEPGTAGYVASEKALRL